MISERKSKKSMGVVIFLCLLFMRIDAAATTASDYTPPQLCRNRHFCRNRAQQEQCVFLILRGGDDDSNEEEEESKASKFFSSIGALLRLNSNVKEEALLLEQEDQDEESVVYGRGGALTMVQTRQQRSTTTTPAASTTEHETTATAATESILVDENTSRGGVSTAAASSRLMPPTTEAEDDDDKEDEVVEESKQIDVVKEDEIQTSMQELEEDEEAEDEVVESQSEDEGGDTSSVTDVARLWWANEWIQQRIISRKAELIHKDLIVPDKSDQKQILVVEEQQQEEDEQDEEQVQVEMPHGAAIEKEEESKETKRKESDLRKASSAVEEPAVEKETMVETELLSEKMSEDTPVSPTTKEKDAGSSYLSTGYWGTIDKVASLGLSTNHEQLRLSRHLRSVRKATARVTGLHGLVSGKGRRPSLMPPASNKPATTSAETLDEQDMVAVRRRLAAIDKAREQVEPRLEADEAAIYTRKRRFGNLLGLRRRRKAAQQEIQRRQQQEEQDDVLKQLELERQQLEAKRKSLEEEMEEQKRKERVMEIDKLIHTGQADLLELQCEKDALQRRPNPFYNYTTATTTADDGTDTEQYTRTFHFPPDDLVEEYLDEMFSSHRLVKLNHTQLWKSGAGIDDDDDETIGDDLLTPSGDAHRLYENTGSIRPRRGGGAGGSTRRGGGGTSSGNSNGGGGSWLLRQTIGKGGSLGEKIGEAVEAVGYKAVCAAVMGSLARGIGGLHGINVMSHSDIRLFMEQSPDLPPVYGKGGVIPGSDNADNYAQEKIRDAMQKGIKKSRKRRSSRISEEAFIQRDAVVEMLISHCQISTPLLKLFPLAWQRGLLGNMITLIAAVVSDFCDGIQLQILGHQLSFAFKPITERDMMTHMAMAGYGYNKHNSRRARPEQFEAAVRATAEDVSEQLRFLDRWHERALGSGMLRAQIANLIARIVLTLTDEVLCGARMDLWAQAGGPRMVAGLEYRTTPNPEVL